MNLGIDIGRVLIQPDGPDGPDTAFRGATIEAAADAAPYEGMFEVVPDLVRRFQGRVWLVSKAYPKMQAKTRYWLAHHRFFERTGIAAGNLRFCLERHQKADHCRDLAITHFIDDRLDVLAHLAGVVPHRYLFGPQRDGTPIAADPGMIAVPTWAAVRRLWWPD